MRKGGHDCTKALTILLCLIATSAKADVDTAASTESHTRIEVTDWSESDRQRAAVWNLSEDEWQRYEILLKGIRGSVSPASLSPVEVLGIHARDDAERRRYAEQWARAMRDDAERILAFQRAYDAAARQLFGDQDLIDSNRFAKRETTSPDLQPGDRLLFFTVTRCPSCDAVFATLLSRIESIDGVDVYFLDSSTTGGQNIRGWAKRMKVDSASVRSRRITLNVDDGVLHDIHPDAAEPPLLFRNRNGAITPLAYSDL